MELFEQDYAADPELARRFLIDPYKAPEQQKQAREYLERIGELENTSQEMHTL